MELSSHECPDSAVLPGTRPDFYRTCTFHNLYLWRGRAYYVHEGVNEGSASGRFHRPEVRLCGSSSLRRVPLPRTHDALRLWCPPAGTAPPDLASLGLRFEPISRPLREKPEAVLEFMATVTTAAFSDLLQRGAAGAGGGSAAPRGTIPLAYFQKGAKGGGGGGHQGDLAARCCVKRSQDAGEGPALPAAAAVATPGALHHVEHVERSRRCLSTAQCARSCPAAAKTAARPATPPARPSAWVLQACCCTGRQPQAAAPTPPACADELADERQPARALAPPLSPPPALHASVPLLHFRVSVHICPTTALPSLSFFHHLGEWMPALTFTLCEQFGAGGGGFRARRRGGGGGGGADRRSPCRGCWHATLRHCCATTPTAASHLAMPANVAPSMACRRPAAAATPRPKPTAGHCTFADRSRLQLIDVNSFSACHRRQAYPPYYHETTACVSGHPLRHINGTELRRCGRHARVVPKPRCVLSFAA